MLVAGIDSSTQGCKVVVIDAETGEQVRMARGHHDPGTEVPAEMWYDVMSKAISQAGGFKDVAAVSVGGQQHGLVALGIDGRPVRKALLWNDTRSASSASDIIREAGGAAFMASTLGVVPVAAFTSAKLRWVRDNEPENAKKIAAVALPHDYLTWRLLGYGPQGESEYGPQLEKLVTDRSDASGTAYWSNVQGKYLPEMFELAFGRTCREANGQDKSSDADSAVIVPRVLGPSESAGKSPSGFIVGPGAGDNGASALGLGAQIGDIVISLGTSGTVFSPTELPVSDPTGLICGFADCTGQTLPLLCTLNGAPTIDQGAHMLGVDHDGFEKLALKAKPGSGGLALVPYFEGERTPNLPTATASLRGMSLSNATRENVARAYAEGLLCSMADCTARLLHHGVLYRRVILIGGASVNKAIQEVASTVINVPIVIPQPGEYVARGAAVQAAWVLKGERPQWKVPMQRELRPNLHPEVFTNYKAAQTEVYAEFCESGATDL